MQTIAGASLSNGVIAGLVVFGVLSLGTGAGLLYDGFRRIRFRRRARSAFERVDATVVESAVHEPAAGGSKALPGVEYEYTVDGETYASRRLWPTRQEEPGRVDVASARRIVEDYPEGASVIARYDPDDPGTAYLIDQVDPTWQRLEVLAGLTLVLAFVAAALAVLPALT